MTISDVTFCQEEEQIDGVTQNFKSQQACITALALGKALNAGKMLIHPLSWSSTRIRRVCRSTPMAEAHALSNAVEHGLRTGATIVDMRTPQYSSMGGNNFHSDGTHLVYRWRKPLFSLDIPKYQTSRQQTFGVIDLSVLKQLIREKRDDCDQEVDGSKGDYPRWIDTSAMLSDSPCPLSTPR